MGQQITLGSVAAVSISDGPPMLKSENARPSGWVYVDVRGRDLASVVADLRSAAAKEVPLEPGMSVAFSGSSNTWNAPTRGSRWWCRRRC